MLKPSATSPDQLNSQQPRGSCSSLEAALPALEAVPMVTGRRGKGKRRDAWRPLKVWPCARQALTSQTCQGQGTVKVHGGGRGPFPQSQAHSLPSETGDLDGGTETRTPVPTPSLSAPQVRSYRMPPAKVPTAGTSSRSWGEWGLTHPESFWLLTFQPKKRTSNSHLRGRGSGGFPPSLHPIVSPSLEPGKDVNARL